MANRRKVNIRENGIYYTPPDLARFLVKPLIVKPDLSVFDPAYGEGALLLAAEQSFRKGWGVQNPETWLNGCDIAPSNGYLSHLPESNLRRLDFFQYPFDNKFDVIVMNPPFVRHHFISSRNQERYREITAHLYQSDTPRRAGGLMSWAASKAVDRLTQTSR